MACLSLELGFERLLRRRGFEQQRVDGLVEVVRIGDLNPLLRGDDEDGGGLGEADLYAEVVVGLDLGGKLAGGVDDEGMVLPWVLEELLVYFWRSLLEPMEVWEAKTERRYSSASLGSMVSWM